MRKNYNEVKDSLLYFRAEYGRFGQLLMCGRFVNERVDKKTVPNGIYTYECSRGDNKRHKRPVAVKKGASEDFCGTLFLESKLEFEGIGECIPVKNVSITKEKKIKKVFAGTIEIKADRIDVTDPGYDKDVWCRMKAPIIPGNYECYAEFEDFPDWGNRCVRNYIINSNPFFKRRALYRLRNNYTYIGNIGVDAGLAGFFDNKPDFDDAASMDVCSFMDAVEKGGSKVFVKHFETGDGFWTHSGFGDGFYPVKAAKHNGQVIGLEIEFNLEDD
ncbi:LPD28 domain-containing protein [Ructibacterium gallinarum]|uniref:Large polyvalent protein associated domain-containing protein n=1 Tax=Ructibacterium gallinarum TaxID=2779355 RepID=A0A9D5LZ93_9FIRM|nr:LPD28 domain-containing protein [Ructibacterium gallinarum]MBE5040788.1 hypothetical protein [Ructibacterium gallinarum]